MRILVAGGGGFLGSALVELLLERRHDVVVVDTFVTGRAGNLGHLAGPRLRVVRTDVAAAPFGRYDRVYHLASPASPMDYWRRPIETLVANADGTRRLLDVAARSGARFLFTSTSEVYGDPLVHPQPETYFGNVDPIGPRSCYDEGKRYGEALTVAYARERDVDARIVRVFNSYGPRMRLDDGRMPAAFIVAALAGRPLVVHGSGRQTRSLCYVADTAGGLVAAMERGRAGEAYNIGADREISVIAFARAVLRVTRSRSPIRHAAARREDPRRRRPNVAKARRELGWRATTTFEDGLSRTVAWYAERLTHR